MIGQGRVTIRKTSIRNFTGFGVDLQSAAGSPAPRVLIQDSIITGNLGGFNVKGVGGTANNGEVLNTVIDANTSFGIQVDQGAAVVLSASVLSGAPNSIIVVASTNGQVISYGNNVLRNAGAPTSTPPLQ
jgi:hypothetical protein